ncbi:MAG TPA: hypothetical protein VEB64_15160 [Azospirillaceae bacterium]|nr:hypothetical protein [Azospirillaceae bacterium]
MTRHHWLIIGVLAAALIATVVGALDPNFKLPPERGLDKLLHIGVFTFLSILAAFAQPGRLWPWRTVLALAAFSLGLEVAQGFDAARDASLKDAVASLMGVATGSIIGQWSLRARS